MKGLADQIVEVLQGTKNEKITYDQIRSRVLKRLRDSAKAKKVKADPEPTLEDFATALCALEKDRTVRSRLYPRAYKPLGEKRVYWLA
jgi:hypothetical protein